MSAGRSWPPLLACACIVLLASCGSCTDLAPSHATGEAGGPEHDEGAAAALDEWIAQLVCRPKDGHACATKADELGKVEDAFPRSEVVGSRSDGQSVELSVLRYRSTVSDGVLFRYRLDDRGAIVERECMNGVPEAGIPLAHARTADAIEGDRLLYWDRCTFSTACHGSVGRAVSFGVDEHGALVHPRELGPRQLESDESSAVDCFFPPYHLRLPEGPIRVAASSGAAWEGTGGKALVPDAGVEGSRIFLAPSSTLDLLVAGTLLRFQSDPDLGLRLELAQTEELAAPWAWLAESFGTVSPLIWAEPFVSNLRVTYRIDGPMPRKVCSHLPNVFEPVCTRGCLEFRRSGGPVVANGQAYFPGPGLILAGPCVEEP